jgi:hypothetical protein
MKTMVLFLLLVLVTSRCSYHSINPQICHEGVIIGKIRSSGGGIAVSMKDSTLSSHEWHGYDNVIEALNIPDNLWQPGQNVYFFARQPTKDERFFPVTADGDESNKPLIFVLEISATRCPVLED